MRTIKTLMAASLMIMIVMTGFGLIDHADAGWDESVAGQVTTDDNVGVGTTTPAASVETNSTDESAVKSIVTRTQNKDIYNSDLKAYQINLTDNYDTFTGGKRGWAVLSATGIHQGDGGYAANMTGGWYQVLLEGSAIYIPDVRAQINNIAFRSSAGESYTLGNGIFGNISGFTDMGPSQGTYNIPQLASYYSSGITPAGTGTFNITDMYHVILNDWNAWGGQLNLNGTQTNAGGILIRKQDVQGANNTGIWLDGDGEGADIAFGPNQESKIYGEAGNLILDTSGNVGIGTSNPSEKLYVDGNTHVTGNITTDGNIGAKYQDLAEWVMTSETLTPGTVVMIDTDKIDHVIPSDKEYNTLVAGVVSPAPGILLGEEGENKAIIAHTGRVKVKVDTTYGEIRTGDLLVTSPLKGYAMKADRNRLQPGMLLGKALQPLKAGEKGEVLALITLQ